MSTSRKFSPARDSKCPSENATDLLDPFRAGRLESRAAPNNHLALDCRMAHPKKRPNSEPSCNLPRNWQRIGVTSAGDPTLLSPLTLKFQSFSDRTSPRVVRTQCSAVYSSWSHSSCHVHKRPNESQNSKKSLRTRRSTN